MDQDNQAVLDYYLFPRSTSRPGVLHLREENGLLLDGFRCDILGAFFYLASRIPMGRTA